MAETNKKILIFILNIFLLALIALAGVKVANEIKEGEEIGQETIAKITVSGTSEIYVKPDLAVIDISVITQKKTVDEALSENAKSMNAVIDSVKNQGIEEKDIKTIAFNISPRYEYLKEGIDIYLYPSGKRTLVGYEVTQSLEVKIRDMTKIGELIQGATDNGANDIGDLFFTIDNQDEFKAQAKAKAIEEAKNNAQTLASQLGVKLVRVLDFSENTYTPNYVNYFKDAAVGLESSSGPAPQIQTGENKIESTVTITYEIK